MYLFNEKLYSGLGGDENDFFREITIDTQESGDDSGGPCRKA